MRRRRWLPRFTKSLLHARICSAQFRNLRNLEIALRILGIPKMRANLEIVAAQSRDCTAILHNLEIAQRNDKIAQSRRLCKRIAQCQDCLHNLEIGTQFRDSENVLRNLGIAQIPTMRRTYIHVLLHSWIHHFVVTCT